MNKFLLTVILLSISQVTFSQHIENLFDEFRYEKHADYVSVSPLLLTIGKLFIPIDDKDDTGSIASKSMIKGTRSIKVLDLEECSSIVKTRFQQALKKVSTKGYEELMRIKEDNDNVQILAKMNGEKIREFIVVTSGDEDCTLIQVKGKFSMNHIMNIVKEGNRK